MVPVRVWRKEILRGYVAPLDEMFLSPVGWAWGGCGDCACGYTSIYQGSYMVLCFFERLRLSFRALDASLDGFEE